VPPLPPHITLKQAKNFVSASFASDPNEEGMLIGAAKQVLSSVLPDRH
jgi:pyruvate dehydrogenase (quinone)